MNEDGIKRLCGAVMRGFVAMLPEKDKIAVQADESSCDLAVDVIRSVVRAFFCDDRYANERDCVLRRSVDDRWIITALCTDAVEQYREKLSL